LCLAWFGHTFDADGMPPEHLQAQNTNQPLSMSVPLHVPLPAHHPAGDIDTLVCVPQHISRKDFFTSFYELLVQDPKVVDLHVGADSVSIRMHAEQLTSLCWRDASAYRIQPFCPAFCGHNRRIAN